MHKLRHFIALALSLSLVFFHIQIATSAEFNDIKELEDAWAYLDQGKKAEAFKSFVAGAKKKDPLAIAWVGICYLHGIGIEQDVQKGISVLEDSVKAGSGKGMAELGSLYAFGTYGIEQDVKKAESYAEQGMKVSSPAAYDLMGEMYLFKVFEKQDIAKAIEMYEKAMELDPDRPNPWLKWIKRNPDFVVKADDLDKAYTDNELAAEKKYKGKVVRVSGQMGSVRRDPANNNDPVVTLKPFDKWGIRNMQCYFAKDWENTLSMLETGQTVTIQGEVWELHGDLYIVNCWVVFED